MINLYTGVISLLKINTEFRKGIMFIRIKGSLTRENIDSIEYEDFKYVVFNLDNLLSIDSYAINYIIKYNDKMLKDNGKLIICENSNSLSGNLFKNRIPIIDNEIKAFKMIWKEFYGWII